MPVFEAWDRILGFAIAALSAVLAIHLWIQGLARAYPVFTTFLAVGAVRSFFVAAVKMAPTTYAYFFIATELIQMSLYFLMVLELYGLVFREYTGIRRVSRFAVTAAFLAAIGISAVTLQPEMAVNERNRRAAVEKAQQAEAADAKKTPEAAPRPKAKDNRWLLDLFMISERGVLSALTLMIIGMSLFLAWFPIKLPRNVLLHCIVFAAFFLSKASILLYRNVAKSNVAVEWRSAALVIGIVCLVVWIAGLRKPGEVRLTVSHGIWNPEKEEALMIQLKGINAALGRLARE